MTGQLDILSATVKPAWQSFLDVFEPLRPDLYRYCRYLTRSTWDAEDLAQDALARGFVTLGCRFHELPNPRAWLFRVASNLWLDRVRRNRERPLEDLGTSAAPEPRAPREAAGTLLVRLSPQERAAVVLMDVFDFSLEEIAEALGTTVGAVKAALHRGRGKLASEPMDAEGARVPAPGVLDEFCLAFNARDIPALTALLLDSATVEIVGLVTEYGKEAETGSFAGSLVPISFDERRGGVDPSLVEGYLGSLARCEVRVFRDEPILVFFYEHAEGELVRDVIAVETEGEKIVRLRNYFFTPDVIAEVCRALGLPFRTNGYRYW